MRNSSFSRREITRLFALLCFGILTGCKNQINKVVLTSVKGILPQEFLKTLPKNWEIKLVNLTAGKLQIPQSVLIESNYIALNDGWIKSFKSNNILKFDEDISSLSLDSKAIYFLKGLGQEYTQKALPIGVSPWIMLFRNGEKWFDKAENGWDVLLDKKLKHSIILPNSPRLIISISEQMKDPYALKKLRENCNIYDDKNALNWLISNQFRVAILPLRSCWKSLFRDPRLRAILPKSGAPLNWTVLIRPKNGIREIVPINWNENFWNKTSHQYLLSRGWVPPLPIAQLRKLSNRIDNKFSSILLPPEETWNRCWSLPVINSAEENQLEKLWKKTS